MVRLTGTLTKKEKEELEASGWVFESESDDLEEGSVTCWLENSLYDVMTGNVTWPKPLRDTDANYEVEYGPGHRTDDPWTSANAARKQHGGSGTVMLVIAEIMGDGEERIDDEIHRECENRGCKRTVSAIHHARLNLCRSGLLEPTGRKRDTWTGTPSQTWVITRQFAHDIESEGLDYCLDKLRTALGKAVREFT